MTKLYIVLLSHLLTTLWAFPDYSFTHPLFMDIDVIFFNMLINAKYMQTTVHCLDTDLLVYYVQYVAGLYHCIQDGRSMWWFPQVYESASYCLKT